MNLALRKLVDKIFSALGILSMLMVTAFLAIFLFPILWKGSGAFVFKGTIEYREMVLEQFARGDAAELEKERAQSEEARAPVYSMMNAFEAEIKAASFERRTQLSSAYRDVKKKAQDLLGPRSNEMRPLLKREQYGQVRWDRALVALDRILFVAKYDYSDQTKMGQGKKIPRVEAFRGTALEPLFPYLEEHFVEIMQPRLTFYWRFLFDESFDAHFFGGIWPEVLGTLYLTIGAILFAVPIGVLSAIYLIEYAKQDFMTRTLRSFISALAGVPSIVFGLFGLAFFINTMHVSHSKSVLAGSMTLAILILPVIIRASEEAIRAVPRTYKEASLSLGASQWRTVVKVLLPAALPGILTGIIISMGRAAGETAPIIFTAAVSMGGALKIWQVFTQPTPALPWNIYNLATEHQAVDEIRHVQYGMVLTLVGMVLLLNLFAILLRARILRRLRG